MEETCTIDYQYNVSYTITTDQWSSTSSPRSPPSTALLPLHHDAGGGNTSTGSSSKLCRMDSGTSVILNPAPRDKNEPADEPKKLPSPSKYKGVVPQPNGRWGAQIYMKHKRVWLGTFEDEETAAKAYDIAAQRLRGWNAYTNFVPLLSSDTTKSRTEMEFLTSRSEADIIDMLRKQTYYCELQRSRSNSIDSNNLSDNHIHRRTSKARVQLFEKVVTPSDIGKLNRLVIPKQQAERHFPALSGPRGCMLLNFLDVNEKVWRFRYSYWKSSRSYVLSRGWSWFVKDKKLKAGDVVSFERSSGQLYITFRSSGVQAGGEVHRDVPGSMVLRLFGVDIARFSVSRDAVEVC